MFKLLDRLEVSNTLGECVIWDEKTGSTWWTDINGQMLYRYDFLSKLIERWPTPERLASFGLVEDADYLVAAFASGVAFYEPRTQAIKWLHKIEADSKNTRLNDGRVDRQGRFWFGTMREYEHLNQLGSLYSLDAGLNIASHLNNIHVSNGLCFAPDGNVVYHTDTVSKKIYTYPLNIVGELGSPHMFACLKAPASPDGATVDAEGFLWSAQWGASRVARYAPTGEIDLVLELPVTQPTCVAFGGEDLNLLFVTTARQGLDERELISQPNAGDVFIFETGYQGLAESRFRGVWLP